MKFVDNKIRKKVEAIILNDRLKQPEKKEKILSLIAQTINLGKSLSESFLREINEYIDGYYFTQFQNLSLDFIRQFKNKKIHNYDWINFFKVNQNVNIKFYQEFKERFNWAQASKIPFRFTNQFLEKYQEKIEWFWLSNFINLTEEFVDKFYYLDLDWQYITNNIDLTEQFIERYHTKLNMREIVYNKMFKFSSQFKKKHPQYFPM